MTEYNTTTHISTHQDVECDKSLSQPMCLVINNIPAPFDCVIRKPTHTHAHTTQSNAALQTNWAIFLLALSENPLPEQTAQIEWASPARKTDLSAHSLYTEYRSLSAPSPYLVCLVQR
jgi:hypothetical protein